MRTIINGREVNAVATFPIPKPAPKRILVVEDDPALMALYEIIFQSEGYTIISAESGEEAVAIFQRDWRHIALIISDVTLPGIHAAEMLGLMKKVAVLPCVLICSGAVDFETEAELREAGATSFLSKPFRNHQIINAAESLMAPRMAVAA